MSVPPSEFVYVVRISVLQARRIEYLAFDKAARCVLMPGIVIGKTCVRRASAQGKYIVRVPWGVVYVRRDAFVIVPPPRWL